MPHLSKGTLTKWKKINGLPRSLRSWQNSWNLKQISSVGLTISKWWTPMEMWQESLKNISISTSKQWAKLNFAICKGSRVPRPTKGAPGKFSKSNRRRIAQCLMNFIWQNKWMKRIPIIFQSTNLQTWDDYFIHFTSPIWQFDSSKACPAGLAISLTAKNIDGLIPSWKPSFILFWVSSQGEK